VPRPPLGRATTATTRTKIRVRDAGMRVDVVEILMASKGNFANRPTEEVRAIAAKGGHHSHDNDAAKASSADTTDTTETADASNTNSNPGKLSRVLWM